MSTLKVDAIRHNSATSDAITTVADGTCTAKLTSIAGSQLSNRNMIINGGMTISERGTGALTVSNSGQNYQVDMYRGRAQGGGQFTIQQVTDAPSGTGLYNSSKLQVTTADTSVGTTDYYEFIQYIEGYNFLPTEYGGSGAKTCTLSFYVKSNIANTFTGAIGNVGNNRGFGFNYTINSANTWERKTITIPGDTTGSWNKANSVGAKIIFSLGIGSQFATANVNTWETRETMGTDDGYSLIGSTSNNLYITGIQFEVGDTATSFEHRNISDELRRCQRYFQVLSRNTSAGLNAHSRYPLLGNGTNSTLWYAYHKVTMRVKPSLITSNITTTTMDIYNYSTSGGATYGGTSMAEGDENHSQITITTTGGVSTAQIVSWRWSVNQDCYWAVSAEF